MADSTFRLIAVVLPLGFDTLGVALALGMAGLPARRRTQIALLFRRLGRTWRASRQRG